jgi:hypothetical protein
MAHLPAAHVVADLRTDHAGETGAICIHGVLRAKLELRVCEASGH